MESCSVCGCVIFPGENSCLNCGAHYDRAAADNDRAHAAAPPSTISALAEGNGQSLGGLPKSPVSQPIHGLDIDSEPERFNDPQPSAACPGCGRVWAGSQACESCGQVWGTPKGIVLSSPARRFGAWLLDWTLGLGTLWFGVWITTRGWAILILVMWLGLFIWWMIAWNHGQTPGKQVLRMRVVLIKTRKASPWGAMFLREVVCKTIVGVGTSAVPLIGGVVACCWLTLDDDKQELWDKISGTVVVNDPERLLAPPPQWS